MCISFEDAKRIIDQVRNVKFKDKHDNRYRPMDGPWIDAILRSTFPEAVPPTGSSCVITRNSAGIVHATADSEGGTGPICRWKKGPATSSKLFKAEVVTVGSLEDAAAQFGGKFRTACEPLPRASLTVKVRRLW